MTIQGRIQSISMQDLAVMELPEFAKLWTVSMHCDMPDNIYLKTCPVVSFSPCLHSADTTAIQTPPVLSHNMC